MERKKRSGFTNGLIKAEKKLLDGSLGGILVEIVNTLDKPIYNWVIGTDNNAVMKRFTTIMLPETQFHGHHDKYIIASYS